MKKIEQALSSREKDVIKKEILELKSILEELQKELIEKEGKKITEGRIETAKEIIGMLNNELNGNVPTLEELLEMSINEIKEKNNSDADGVKKYNNVIKNAIIDFHEISEQIISRELKLHMKYFEKYITQSSINYTREHKRQLMKYIEEKLNEIAMSVSRVLPEVMPDSWVGVIQKYEVGTEEHNMALQGIQHVLYYEINPHIPAMAFSYVYFAFVDKFK